MSEFNQNVLKLRLARNAKVLAVAKQEAKDRKQQEAKKASEYESVTMLPKDAAAYLGVSYGLIMDLARRGEILGACYVPLNNL